MPDVSPAPTATAEFPRQFLAPDAEFGTWETAEKYYRELAERPIESFAEFEKWMLDFSEIDGAFDEECISRRIEMTRATDDPKRERRYLDFVENVQPHREPWHDQLRRKFVENAKKFPLPQKRYEVLERSIRNSIELFRKENIPLEVEHAKLIQQYQKITGAMTVTYSGREMTLQQLGRFLEEPDRKVREETFRLGSDRFRQDARALDELYDQMVKLRDRMARNADCQDYRQYAFKAMERFDYSPEDCLAFHDAIEQVVLPAVRQLAERRKKKLGVETLRPWDMAVDPENRPPLRPFETDEQLKRGCSNIFHQVNRELGQIFATLGTRRLLDLDSRKGKAPGGYQETYEERREPFIFMNAVGTEGDVRTLLHEGGHAFHTWACRNEPLLAYRHYPIEFAEVASMGMEMLALPHLEEFYGDETNRARRRFLEGIVQFFPFMARVDALQHWVYTHVDAGLEDRKDEWQRLTQRFSPHVDWSGLEAYDRHSWHRKLHFFEVPFYYVEYGIAQLGALQVWMNARKDYEQAVALYRNGLALGGSRPLPELFEAAGLKFDFSEKTLRPLIEAVMEEIDTL
ncbi:MAG: M3 family oligoendopeptidase [Phycisphaerae bacterium]